MKIETTIWGDDCLQSTNQNEEIKNPTPQASDPTTSSFFWAAEYHQLIMVLSVYHIKSLNYLSKKEYSQW